MSNTKKKENVDLEQIIVEKKLSFKKQVEVYRLLLPRTKIKRQKK